MKLNSRGVLWNLFGVYPDTYSVIMFQVASDSFFSFPYVNTQRPFTVRKISRVTIISYLKSSFQTFMKHFLKLNVFRRTATLNLDPFY